MATLQLVVLALGRTVLPYPALKLENGACSEISDRELNCPSQPQSNGRGIVDESTKILSKRND